MNKEINLDKLKEWMRYEWNYSTHPKYKHLFEDWWENITPEQIEGFNKQMYHLEHGLIGKTSNYFCKL